MSTCLTDKGKACLLVSSGYDFLQKNKLYLLDQVKEKNPKNAYDVQTYSLDVIKDQTNLDGFNEIKDYAFKEGLELELIVKIMGTYLRDIALKEIIL